MIDKSDWSGGAESLDLLIRALADEIAWEHRRGGKRGQTEDIVQQMQEALYALLLQKMLLAPVVDPRSYRSHL